MDNLKMLPELLFTVGSTSMQDISRDDFSLLNGGDCITAHATLDRDMCPTLLNRIQNPSPLNPHALALPKHLSPVEDNVTPLAFASVKLEDSNGIDLFPSHPSTWQQHPMNSHELAHHRLTTVASHQQQQHHSHHPHHSHHLHHSHHRFENNNSKLLLQGSDDPLISHGANSVLSHDDEHPADFAKCLMTTMPVEHKQETTHFVNSARITQTQSQPQIQLQLTPQTVEPQRPVVKSGCSNLTKQQLKVKANLMSARNQQQQQMQQQQKDNIAVATAAVSGNAQKQRPLKTKKKPSSSLKLRFHHQALPPEYLSHYEATQGQGRTSKSKASAQQRVSPKQTQNPNKPSQPRNSHENVRSWLQKIAEIQRSANASKAEDQQALGMKSKEKVCDSQPVATSNRHTLDANNNPNNNAQNQKRLTIHPPTASIPSTSGAVLNHNIQLTSTSPNNSRRSVYYSDLPYMGEITLDNSKPRRGRKPKKADICHLIYKNYGTILSKRPDAQEGVNIDSVNLKLDGDVIALAVTEDQPLNLCLRDQTTDAYSISSADDASDTNSSCPTPVTTPSDFVRDSMLANNLKSSLSNLNEVESEKIKTENPIETSVPSSVPLKSVTTDDALLNPLTAYYQKLLESGVLLNNTNGAIKTIQKDNQLALKIPLPTGMFLPTKFEKPNAISPALSSMEYPEQLSTPSSIKSENSTNTNVSSSTVMGTTTTGSSVNGQQQQMAPQKRKRSAIFIPPMNTENTSNPTTEVSICKFKFTGGSKPTLQEKKMLSVDAGGNYRYFSGTGDKTSRGYEYFPRESLQQTAGLLPGVNCVGQKLNIDIPAPTGAINNELLYTPESPTASVLLSNATMSSTTVNNIVGISPKTPSPSPLMEASKIEGSTYSMENENYSNHGNSTSHANALNNRYMMARKKQALHQLRKSTQREKLEKTFKEQGFLIQTQQLESAEGATYCKFRQLKKFTRYLFRNWKDYLPDDLQKNTSAAALAAAAAAAEDFTQRVVQEKKLLATGKTAAAATLLGAEIDNDLGMMTGPSCMMENVMACREENIL